MHKRLLFLLIVCFFIENIHAQNKSTEFKIPFNNQWEFVKDVDTLNAIQSFAGKAGNKIVWEKISLPHTPRIEPIEKKEEQWQGTCYYRKNFSIATADKGKHIALQFDAAMHEADIYLDGKSIFKHVGGYLPFYIDISDMVRFGGNNVLLIKLNNQDNAAIPPGKPIKDLDFNYYGGIYRNAWLIVKDKLHIADAIEANREAGGGVILHYETVSDAHAQLFIKTLVKNDHGQLQKAQVKVILTDQKGREVASALSPIRSITNNNNAPFDQQINITNPSLWSPENPYLYLLTVQVLRDGKVIDVERIRTGVKTFQFEPGRFVLNGKKVFLRGTNRHQEYPWIGYALSDNAQYRDAYKIKQAGFNFVRCSHYPPAPAFLDACDELGILVMNSIPGWQFFGKEAFQENSFQNIRDMIHRDRNRPSIILWEASLNETEMSKEYMERSNAIVHKELPFADVFTCGWLEGVYDVFIPARQHAKAPDYWKKYAGKPILIAEYGDWEYYAANAGFNQKDYADLKKEERTSRQLRGAGEKALLQQALNYQEAHNDNLYGPAVGDANWLSFDYKRGYADDLESSGIFDINRLPKFSFYLYQSQCRAAKEGMAGFGKPMIFIANYWNNPATKEVKVYSNCDEVKLMLNGKIIASQRPDKDGFSTNLLHPPFTFKIDNFEPGTLTAIGYDKGKRIISAEQKTPGKAAAIELSIDYSGKKIEPGKPDVVFVYARVVDASGTLVADAKNPVQLIVKGKAELVGVNPVSAEAGIATFLLKISGASDPIIITASSENVKGAVIKVYPTQGK